MSGTTSYFAQLVMQHSAARETAVPSNTLLDGGNSDAAARWDGPCAPHCNQVQTSSNGLLMFSRAVLHTVTLSGWNRLSRALLLPASLLKGQRALLFKSVRMPPLHCWSQEHSCSCSSEIKPAALDEDSSRSDDEASPRQGYDEVEGAALLQHADAAQAVPVSKELDDCNTIRVSSCDPMLSLTSACRLPDAIVLPEG